MSSNESVQKHEHTHEIIRHKEDIQRKERRDFMHHAWKPLAATVYLIICLFDFVIAPIYFAEKRQDYVPMIAELSKLEPSVQMAVVNSERSKWESLTLAHGGLFHLSFGAILTGVAVVGHRGLKNKTQVIQDRRKL